MMIRAVLARNDLMACFGGEGWRPWRLFGPRRDAASLLCRQVQQMLVFYGKGDDRDQVVAIPLGPAEGSLAERAWLPLGRGEVRTHRLRSDLDELEVTWSLEPGVAWMDPVDLRIRSVMGEGGLWEQWHLDGPDPDRVGCCLVHWYAPEIGASSCLQSTAWDAGSGLLYSWRGSVCFGIRALQDNRPARVMYAMTGRRDHHGAVDQVGTMVSHLNGDPWNGQVPVSHGQTDGLVGWDLQPGKPLDLHYPLADHLDLLCRLPGENFTEVRERVCAMDAAFLQRQRALSKVQDEKLADLYDRTLLVLRQMQDPGGGIIAAPEFDFEFEHCGGYGYCWGRDAAWISWAMDLCGMHEHSAKFYRYMIRCQSEDGSFLHRHDMDGHPGPSWGLLQPDETGSVLFGLQRHLELSGSTDPGQEILDMVIRAGNWLADHSGVEDGRPVAGFDLWEEREGIHLYSVAAMAGGLRSGARILEQYGRPVPTSWPAALANLIKLIHSPLFQPEGRHDFARYLDSRGHPELTPDIAQLGVVFPFDVLDQSGASGERYNRYLDELGRQLWRPGGGIGRYVGDPYRGGQAWVLTTLWLALAAARAGHMDLARRCWIWIRQVMPDEGLLPEQVDTRGQPSWVMPLTWSHAMFALALHLLPADVLSAQP